MLNAKTGFFSDLVPVVVQHFGEAFPELRKSPDKVRALIREEEESFGKTLDRGIKLFTEVATNAKDGVIHGADAFTLYDTFGFPIDLTKLMAEERGLRVNETEYEQEVEKAKELSRSGGKQEASNKLVLTGETVARLKHMGIQPTDDSFKFETKPVRAHVRAIWNGHNFDDHTNLHMGNVKKLVGIIVDRTNFYSTMGGQDGDSGHIHVSSSGHTGEFEVESTEVFGGYVLHIGRMSSTSSAATRSRRTTPRRTWPTGPFARCWARTCTRRAASSRPTRCGLTSATTSPSRPSNSRRLRNWSASPSTPTTSCTLTPRLWTKPRA
jgi:alanyl-tRNA synthetase